MGYMSINNLYKDQSVLMFKEVFVLEKIHGTSAHISFKDNNLHLFSGGEKHDNFAKLFDLEDLKKKILENIGQDIVIYGEAYGGKQQGMSDTYGKELKFVCFDVKIHDMWLNVPKAEKVCNDLGLDFVHYLKSSTNLEELDSHRDFHSVQAIKNGIGEGKTREGIIIRPLIELKTNDGSRLIAKHKNDKFCETKENRKIVDPNKLQVLAEAEEVCNQWITLNRLKNILSHHPDDFQDIKNTGIFIKLMIDDIRKESDGEIVWSKDVEKQLHTRSALIFKDYLKNKLYIKQ
jgi:hypothetical protein